MANIKGQSGIEVIDSGRGKPFEMNTSEGSTMIRVQGPEIIKILENGSYCSCECGSDVFQRSIRGEITCKHCDKDHSAIYQRVFNESLFEESVGVVGIPFIDNIRDGMQRPVGNLHKHSTPITLKNSLVLVGIIASVLGAIYLIVMYVQL